MFEFDGIAKKILNYDNLIPNLTTFTLLVFTVFIFYGIKKILKHRKSTIKTKNENLKRCFRETVGECPAMKKAFPVTEFQSMEQEQTLSKEERKLELDCQRKQMELIFKLLKEAESKEDQRIYVTKSTPESAAKPVMVQNEDENIKNLVESQLKLYGIKH